MKKITIILTLLMSNVVLAAENLTLSCDGISNVTHKLKDGTDKNYETTKKKSYVFKDGYLITGKLKIKCDWSEEEIRCNNFGEDKPSLTLYFNVNRITGYYDSSLSWWNSQREIFISEELQGICIAQKRKF